MTASSIRQGITWVAVAAALVDVVLLITCALSGGWLGAALALVAAVLSVGGATWGGNRLQAWSNDQQRALEHARSEASSLQRQLTETSDVMRRADVAAGMDDSQSTLTTAARTIEGVVQSSTQQLDKADKAQAIASKMSDTVETVDKATKENITGIENVSHAVIEISRALEETATNAQKVAAASEEAASLAQRGEDAVRRTIGSIGLIKQTVLGSAEKVQQLAARANQIGDIVKLIDDIADQTNLLALNAAIEAARAGEQGKGFAVVATEVRKLAEKTSRATKDIGELIKTTQDETAAAVDAMHVGSQEVEEGSTLGAEAGNALQQILDSVARNTEQVQNISAAVEEMTAAANEIVNAVESQADRYKLSSHVTSSLLSELEQLTSHMQAVAVICRNNAAATEELDQILRQRGANGAAARNGDLALAR